MTVYSAAMNRDIPLRVLRPADDSVPRPTFYLLAGVDGGEDGGGWLSRTDVVSFFADKNVNVVLPLAGEASEYTDWQRDDPVLGRNKWATFLTAELPEVIDSTFHTSGRNAIAGLSMSATAVLNLAIGAPGMYQAVGSYSGCARTSDLAGRGLVWQQVTGSHGNPINMWGQWDDPDWVAHDPFLRAAELRGTTLYISAGTGLPGPHEVLNSRGVDGNPALLVDRISVGGVFEAHVNDCTREFASRLSSLGIPATVDLQPVGTHSWPYWQDALHRSWPVLARAICA